MTKDAQHVTPRGDQWASQRANAGRASSLHDTQAEAINASRGYLENRGGGELHTHGRNGAIRASDTIKPAVDPRKSRG